MEVLDGPVVVLDGRDCALLGRYLVEAIRLGWISRGRPPPRHLLDFADQVNSAVRGSARFPASSQASMPPETAKAAVLPAPAGSSQPVMLTASEAAKIAEVSVQFMRAQCRSGEVEAVRGRQGSWLVDADDLAGWVARRREDRDLRSA